MSQSRSPLPLIVLVLCLVGVAGGLYYWTGTVGTPESASGHPAAAISPTDLHEAATKGDVAAIEKAVIAKANLDARIEGLPGLKSGLTPLMAAAQAGKADAVRALLKAGAKADATTKDGWTPLHFAACATDAGGDAVKAMLESPGLAVNARTPEGWTPLMLAAGRGSTGGVAAILAKGADVASRNRWGQSALALAARSGVAEKVRAVLSAGPDVDAVDRELKTALHAVAEEPASPEMLAVATLLLDAKADANKADDQGVTPLMKAADRGNVELAKLLLARGANKAAKDANGQTARDWANNRGDDAGKQIAEIAK